MFLRSFLLIFGAELVAPAMILSRTLSCYLVLIAAALVLVVGRAVRKRADNAGKPDPVKKPAVQKSGAMRIAPRLDGLP